jgi:hypothetical protein
VIVNENYRRGILCNCFAKHFAGMHERRVEQPARYCNVALETVLRVEHSDVKFFDRKILQSLSEYFVHIARAADGHALITLLGGHSPAELERGMHRDRACITDATETGEGRDRLR